MGQRLSLSRKGVPSIRDTHGFSHVLDKKMHGLQCGVLQNDLLQETLEHVNVLQNPTDTGGNEPLRRRLGLCVDLVPDAAGQCIKLVSVGVPQLTPMNANMQIAPFHVGQSN